jgi:putative sterol carrier protein
VARFLSQEWIDELNAAARATPADAVDTCELTIQQVVTGTATGDFQYAVRVGDGRVSVMAGRADRADATITEDHTTAVDVARGELSPQAAFLAGRIRVSGDMGALVAAQGALHRLEAAFDQVRGATTF